MTTRSVVREGLHAAASVVAILRDLGVTSWVSFGAGFFMGAAASFLLVSGAEARGLIAERDADTAARRA
jgi:hypothetical protein